MSGGMFGPNAPFSVNSSGGAVSNGTTQTITGTKTWLATAVGSTAEILAKWGVSDDAIDRLIFYNTNAADNAFNAGIQGNSQFPAQPAFTLSADVNTGDSGTQPVMMFQAENGVSAIATRPLFGWYNYTTQVMSMAATGAMTYNVPAIAATAETLATWKVSDDTGASLQIQNASTGNSAFQPLIVGFGGGNLGSGFAALINRAVIPSPGFDTGTAAAYVFDVRSAANAAIATRPLYEWQNNGSQMMQMLPTNAGANATLAFPASGFAAPSFTTRSAGTKLILYPNLSGTTVDNSIGMAANGPFIATAAANTGNFVNFYAGQTLISSIRGDGLLDNTGTIRATGLTAPASGVGGEFYWDGTTANLISISRNGAGYQPLKFQASTITAAPGGSITLTMTSTLTAHSVPEVLASYTVGTLPAASIGAGALAYASNAAGNGPCIAMSNGTVWKRCDNTATTVA